MNWLFRPSLSRRIALAQTLLFLFLMVILNVVAYLRVFFPNAGLFDESRRIMIGSIAKSVAPEVETGQLAAIIRPLELAFGGVRQPKPDYPMHVLIWDRDRKLIYAGEELKEVPFIETRDGFADLAWNGRQYRVATVAQGKYVFALADPVEGLKKNFLSFQTRELAINLAVSFPISLIVILIAIHTGLRPLRELGGGIERRHPDDLSPLPERTPYRELLLTRALDALLAQLRRKIALEKSFVQDAAHEMQTPLAVISNQIHVLASSESDETRDEAKRNANLAIQRNSHLVRQLLELAHLDAERVAGGEVMNLAALARDIVAHLTPKASEQTIELELQAPDVLLVKGDRNAFYAIINNLVDNAIRYIGTGRRVTIEIGCTEAQLFLNVFDDGPGIPETERERVFDRFYRVASRDGDRRGSGLGLAIVKQAVTRMDGSISLSTGLDGRGCAFRIVVPLAPDEQRD